MGARKKSDEAPEEENVLLCPSCVQPVDSDANFCPRCNTPLSTLATIDPIMYLRTYGNFMTRFAGRSPAARIVSVVLLVMFILPLFGYIVAYILGDRGSLLAHQIIVGVPLGIAIVNGTVLTARNWRARNQ